LRDVLKKVLSTPKTQIHCVNMPIIHEVCERNKDIFNAR
jgi:hypothetical protein